MNEDEELHLLNQVKEIVGDSTNVSDGFVAIHELFLTAVASGFTEKQALYIVAMGLFGVPSD